MLKEILKNQKGSLLMYLIIGIFIFAIVMFPVSIIFGLKMNLLRSSVDREEALQIAEAGIDYYKWHLAHYEDDYQDGTAKSGPYVHDFVDRDTQETIGYFSLEITAPSAGSTIVTIESTGWTNNSPNIKRTVNAKFGIPSLSEYAFLSNDIVWIGSDESISGKLMSNNGIRFDGTGNAPIQSAKDTYTCPDIQGSPCPATKNGVWGSASQAVQSFWDFPVASVDFSSITSDLPTIKSDAQTSGIYLVPSNSYGYSLVFNSNGTVSIYKVTKLDSLHTGSDTNGYDHNEATDYKNRSLQYTKTIPDNCVIYIEDDVWIEGTVNGRVTVVAALLPYSSSSAPVIYIPKNIVYSSKDGSDVLGLISQSDLVVTYGASNDLEIDAAIIAQNGGAQFYFYRNNIKKL